MPETSKPYRLTFSLPGLPRTTNANQSRHWREKHQERNHWAIQVGAAVSGKKPKMPLERAKLTLVRFSSSEPDFDGLVSSFKFIVDSLIDCGVIQNDKMTNIGQPSYSWEKVGPKQGKVMVVVEEVAA